MGNKPGQITIIPKPELRGFLGGFPYFSPPFGVSSAEVVIICPDKPLIRPAISGGEVCEGGAVS